MSKALPAGKPLQAVVGEFRFIGEEVLDVRQRPDRDEGCGCTRTNCWRRSYDEGVGMNGC
jgi:hypothetical protein